MAYRPYRLEPGGDQIEIRPVALTIGAPLPTMPLALRGGPTLLVDLEMTYTGTRQRSLL